MDDLNLSAGNVKAAMKEAGAASSDLWKVAPEQLRIIPGFNVRTHNAKYDERVRAICESIKANGYYPDKPLSGYVAREADDNVIYITGGHHRYDAVMLAIAEGVEIPTVPVVVSPKGTSVEDLTIALVTGNEGCPLTVYECAVVCKRLASMGMESTEIRRRLGYASTQYVDGLLLLAAAPLALRNMVINDEVSATVAIDALVKWGAGALDKLTVAKVKAGDKKVTPKDLPGAGFKKAAMFKGLSAVRSDPGYRNLSEEVRTYLDELFGSDGK